MQHWTTSRSLILLNLPCPSSKKSRREEVKLEMTATTGVNSVRGRRVNGLHIQDIYNLFIDVFFLFFNVQFGYLQEKITVGQGDIATPENPGLGNI